MVLIAFIDEIFERFSDITVYFVMGAIGSALFLIRLVMMFVFGVDDGGDFDLGVDADGDVDVHDGGFGIFSMLSILSFSMGAGWLGLLCRMDWGLGPFVSALIASAFGFSLMLFSSFGMYQLHKLNEVGRYDVRTCIGSVGQVYMRIPAKGDGQGKVQINVEGRHKTLTAISTGDAIESFKAVRVVDVRAPETLVVEPE
ncbi:MAG: hypothetical protein CMJ18_08450 [Phycisphaeraceae bacterium]|nr:hypothetical protein [Phycisphaeraceae bacterium]